MSKFETITTKATNYSVGEIDSKEVLVDYYSPDESNMHLIDGLCDFQSVDWSGISLDSECEFELLIICKNQTEYINIGKADPNDPDFLEPRKFIFQRERLIDPVFVLNVFKASSNNWIASSRNIKGNIFLSEEQDLFNWAELEGNFSWDVGMEGEKGPTIYLNKAKLPLIDTWISSKEQLWWSVIIPTALRECLCLYFRNKNSGGAIEPWAEKYDAFLKELDIEIDEELFTDEPDFYENQVEEARRVVDKYSENFDETIKRIERFMNRDQEEEA